MRNLKKILALVLALVMSLSLMATAGASSFPDVDAENPYATAIEVLDELKVFQGYKEDGTFRPTETLNRAQAAVLVYRIATGDVEDKYLDNYTYMQQSKFTDLDGYNWAKGYINYCQNAGIVVGTSATTFDPGAKVTGYQLLVMLLRTLGYGKAGEFADPDGWELKSAEIAESEGITKNVTFGDFGAPAARQMVAEILFRGLLTETVQYSALVPGGYTKSGETLGKREFGLEQVSGVVMANQWANLEGDSVAKADTTVMKIDDKNVTVNKATDLDAVGLTYNAYIANGEGSTKRALTLEKSDVNVVAFNEGARMDVSKLAKDNSLNVNDAEYYLNYAEKWSETATSTWKISYAIDQSLCTTANGWSTYIADINAGDVDGHSVVARQAMNKPAADGGANTNYWYVAIRPGKTITATDLDIMNYIFDVADRQGENVDGTGNAVRYYGIGEVYAGTSSTLDQSDIKSWPQFVEEFLDGQNTNEYEDVENGNSLRIVDNNGDGKAEYVLKVTYTQDKAIGERRDVLQFNKLVISKYEDNNLAMMDEIAVGDVINYTIIDGKLTVYKADMITDTIRNKNFKDTTVIATEEGETHGQSEIDVYTNMETDIMLMAEKTSYNIYFDEFGYIRSYELAQGTQYALLTEMYTTGTQNWNYINTTDWTAEVKIADGDIEELPVANARGNAFISEFAWTSRSHNYYSGNLNFLQPAIAHLGNPASENNSWYWPGKTIGTAAAYSLPSNDWNRGVFQMDPNGPAANPATGYIGGQPAYGVFNYGPVNANYTSGANEDDPVESSFSFTNIAAFTSDGEDISLAPATRLAKNANGHQIYRVGAPAQQTHNNNVKLGFHGTEAELKAEYLSKNPGATAGDEDTWFTNQIALKNGTGIYPVYAIDYVQLTAESVKAGMRHFTIANSYNTNYNTTSNTYVNANSETVFYVVEPGRVTYYDSYEKLPTIKAKDIRAAYAVATNTNANADGMDYWVGDVIVIETSAIDKSWDSISLAYANPYENSGAVRYLSTLNSEWRTYQPDSDELAKIGLVPSDSNWNWGNSATPGHAFYEVYGTDYENGELAAAITEITKDWNDHGIYAGTVRRTRSLTMGNGYIDVDTLGRNNLIYDDSFVKPIDVDYDYEVPFYRISGDWDANEIEFATDWTDRSGVQEGDEIIWVTDKDGDVAFVVDLGSRTKAEMGGDAYTAPSWLLSDRDFASNVIGATITSTSSLYAKILNEQRVSMPDVDLNIAANVGAGTTLTVSLNGTKLGEKKNDTAMPATVTVPIAIRSSEPAVDLTVTATRSNGTNETLTFVLNSTVGPNWSLLSYSGNSSNVYTLRLVNNQIRTLDAISGKLVLFTNEFFNELAALSDQIENEGIDTPDGVSLADAQYVQELLGAVNVVLKDANYTAQGVNGTDATQAVTDKNTAIETAKAAVDSAVDEVVDAGKVTVTVTGDGVEAQTETKFAPGATVTITASTGKKITAVQIDGQDAGTIAEGGKTATYTVPSDATEAITITVTTADDTTVGGDKVTVTFSQVTGATIKVDGSEVTGTKEYDKGATVSFTVEVTDNTKEIKSVTAGSDVLTGTDGAYTFTANADATVTVELQEKSVEAEKVTVTFSQVTGATIKVDGSEVTGTKEYDKGATVSFTVEVTDNTKEIKSVTAGSDVLTGTDGAYTFTANADATVTVELQEKSVEAEKVTVTFSQVTGATIKVDGSEVTGTKEYDKGATVSFTVEVTDSTKEIKSVTAGSDALTEADGAYTFTADADTTVTVELQDKTTN